MDIEDLKKIILEPVIPSDFRLFCHEKWYEHKDEILLWTGDMVDYDSKYYYNKHRWLLKSMFKEQKND